MLRRKTIFEIEALEQRALLAGDLFSGRSYAVGTSPNGIVSADINMDGHADLITANYGSNNLTVLLGASNGTFSILETIATGTEPDGIAAADLNGDNRPDLAVTDYGSNQVTVILFNATTYSTYTYSVGAGPQSIFAADLNGDGKPDLIVANAAGNSVSTLINKGNGLFYPAVNYTVGSDPVSMVVTDLNGDGNPDVAVCNNKSATVSVLLDTAAGTLSTVATYAIGTSPVSIISADVNDDAKPDLVVDTAGTKPAIAVLPNTGNGVFASVLTSVMTVIGGSIAAGNFVGDDASDLVVANPYSNRVTLLLNDGTGRYRTSDSFAAGSGPVNIDTGDFNGDGQTDLAVTDSSGNDVTILTGLGAGQFAAPRTFNAGGSPSSVVGADFAGNGQTEFAVGDAQDDKIDIVSGSGAFFNTYYSTPIEPLNITVADVNNDGKPDLVVAGNGGGLFVMLNNGDGTFGAAQEYLNSVSFVNVAVADFNNDGYPDIASISHTTGGSLYVLLNNGDGTFHQLASPGGTNIYIPGDIVAADVDGDGLPDLVVAASFSNLIYLFHNLGGGTFSTGVTYTAGPTGATIFGVAIADFNADGRPDIAATDYTKNTVSILLNNGNGGFNAPVSYPVGSDANDVIAVDLNGDGLPDLAIANFHSNTISVLLNQGAGLFGATANYNVGSFPEAVAAGDFNGDHLPDLVVANLDDGTLSVFANRSTGGSPIATLTNGTLSISEALGGGPVSLAEFGGNYVVATQVATYTVAASSVSAIAVAATAGPDTMSVQTMLSAPLTYSDPGGADAINLYSGPVSLAYSSASNASSTTLNVDQSAALLPVLVSGANIARFGTINVLANASLSVALQTGSAGQAVLIANTLSIASGGLLNLNRNDLDLGGSSLATIAKYIASDSLVGSPAYQINALALVSNTQAGLQLFSSSHPFENVVPGASDILVKYTYYGDANLDGKVDASDYSRIDNGYLQHLTGWFNGDFNYDGVVNGSDYTLIDNAFNTQGASLAAQIQPASHSSAAAAPAVRFASTVLETAPDLFDKDLSKVRSDSVALAIFH